MPEVPASGTVSKQLGAAVLEAGEIRLTEREADVLGLPPRTDDLVCTHDGVAVPAVWRGPELTICGEVFADTLTMWGRIGGRLRLQRTLAGVELDFASPVRSTSLGATPSRWSTLPATPVAAPARPAGGGARRSARQARESRFRIRGAEEYDWHGHVGIHRPTLERFAGNIAAAQWDPPSVFDLRLRGEQLSAVNDFDELLAVDLANVDHMPHQERTAVKALGVMRGRAILADEVGLGKTIEAGLVMKELVLRGLARRILVLCPATLRDQWREELRDKFDEDFDVVASGGDPLAGDRLILSHHLGVRRREALIAEAWDLVIVDEAHRMSGRNARKSRDLLEAIESRFKLFLTATPVSGDLFDLYRLVELLRPGTFRSEREFRQRYIDPGNKRLPRDPVALRRLVADVMIRTTREQAGLDHVTRYAVDMPIDLSAPERQAYEICTDLLRRVMRDRDDHFRRRSLAQRLTASPRALAVSARKMAQAHSDPTAASVLHQLADLCGDFGLTSRQHELLSLIGRWTADRDQYGKVLVFSQTYETVHDLLRILDLRGIDAVAYHGGLAPKARQKAIERFRSECPVMVSTDAGAEGLNLQFANCVVNYDLPWNPMRIEQRIGRVHRVTQRRDVHVANFFARGTIDEHVYRLLHDKLRMFELLFGQVTTILGEVGGERNEATFENQVLDAYLAPDDMEMARRLEQLGQSVDRAYQAAQTVTTNAGEISSWLVDRSYRSRIDGQATELLPEVELAARKRQHDVQAFAQEWLAAVGASVSYAADDGSFLIADLPDEVGEDLGGRRQLCLAFSPTGLDHHRDAELCAVGSEVFENLVGVLQDRGDLLVEVPHTPDLDTQPVPPAAPGTDLVGREIHGPETWAADAHWRVHAGESSLGEQVVTTEMGDADDLATAAHRPLPAGAELPPTAGTAPEVLRRLVDAALPDLQARQKDLQTDADRIAAEERDRILRSYDERMSPPASGPGRPRAPASDVELDKLRRAREIVANQSTADVELRAEMLSVRLVGGQRVRVLETWRGTTGASGRLACVWDPATGTRSDVLGDDGEPVQVVCVCTDGHVVDAGRASACDTCDGVRCAACDARLLPTPCIVCGARSCGTCRDGDGLCARCHTPARSEGLDRDGMVAWTIGGGRTLLVGERIALVGDELVDALPEAVWSLGPRARAEAGRRGLRADMGVAAAPPPSWPDMPATAFALRDLGTTYQWVVDRAGGAAIERSVVSALPAAGDDGVLAQPRSPLHGIIDRLRQQAPPQPAPRLVLDPVRSTAWLQVEEGRLRVVTRRDTGLGAEPVVEAAAVHWMPAHSSSPASIATAATPLGRLTLRRVHRSHVLDVEEGDSWFIPADAAADVIVEQVAAGLAEQVGLPSGAAVGLAAAEPFPERVASPEGAPCLEFDIASEWRLTGTTASHPLSTGQLTGVPTDHEAYSTLPRPVLDDMRVLVRSLDPAEPSPPAALTRAAIVTATWEGRSRLTRRFVSPPGDVARPPLDDTGAPAYEFTIDDHGHLCEPAHCWECRCCETWRCRACGEAGLLGSCQACGQAACGACRTGDHEARPPASCERCGAVSCTACGRDIRAAACAVCLRSICLRCCDRGTCATCRALTPAGEDTIRSLPPALVADGLRVRLARDHHTMVVALTGAARRELALVENGEIRQWWSIADGDHRWMRLGLAAGAFVGHGDVDVHVDPAIDVPDWDGGDSLPISRSRTALATWLVGEPDGDRVLARSEGVAAARSTADADVLAAIEASGTLGTARAPSPVHDASHHQTLEHVLDEVEGVPQAIGRVQVDVYVDETLVTSAGLVRRLGTARQLEEQVVHWLPGPGPFVGTMTGWPLQPSAASHATLGHAEALVARMGQIHLLATRLGVETSWYRLDTLQETEDPFGGLRLAMLLGRRSACRVGHLVLPEDVTPFTVVNGTLKVRTMAPAVREAVGVGGDVGQDATAAAVALWARQDVPELEGLARLATAPSGLAPLQRNEHWPEDPSIDLAVAFREVWAVPDNEPIEVRYVVEGDSRVGLVAAYDTGVWRPALVADRSGHLTESPDLCNYCRTVTCGRCDAPTRPCWLCAMAHCGRCGSLTAGGPACPACSSLDRLGWRGKRRKPTIDGAILEAGDIGHRVVVAPAEPGGARVLRVLHSAEEATFTVALTSAQRDHLNEIARRHLFH